MPGNTSLTWRNYQSALLGGLGGLFGWYFQVLYLRFSTTPETTLEVNLFRGAILGACIGLGACAYNGFRSGSVKAILYTSWRGLLLGLTAGGLALVAAQMIYQAPADLTSGARLFLAVGCWVFFGTVVGLGEAFQGGDESWKCLLGGAVGGFFGGGFFELFGRETSGPWWQAAAFVVLGAALALSVSLLSTLLTDAWLEILTGKLAGERRSIAKFVHPILGAKRPGLIGSHSGAVHIFLPDANVAQKHASITFKDGSPTLEILAEAVERDLTSQLNGRPVREFPLAPGDKIRLGDTEMIVRARRGGGSTL